MRRERVGRGHAGGRGQASSRHSRPPGSSTRRTSDRNSCTSRTCSSVSVQTTRSNVPSANGSGASGSSSTASASGMRAARAVERDRRHVGERQPVRGYGGRHGAVATAQVERVPRRLERRDLTRRCRPADAGPRAPAPTARRRSGWPCGHHAAMALRVLAVAQAAEPGGAELRPPAAGGPRWPTRAWSSSSPCPAEGGVARAGRERGLAVHELPVGPLRRGGWPRAVLAWPRARALVRRVAPRRRLAERRRAAAARAGARAGPRDAAPARPARRTGRRSGAARASGGAVRFVACASEAVAARRRGGRRAARPAAHAARAGGVRRARAAARVGGRPSGRRLRGQDRAAQGRARPARAPPARSPGAIPDVRVVIVRGPADRTRPRIRAARARCGGEPRRRRFS